MLAASMWLREIPRVVQSEVSQRLRASQRSHLEADEAWRQLSQLAFDHGFTHWSYVAAPTCAPGPRLGEALRVSAYPRGHVETCERYELFSAVPSLAYAFRNSRATYYSVVRDAGPESRKLAAFRELNRQHGVSRGILIPLTDFVGMRAALGLAFDGSDRELEAFWHDRRDAIINRARVVHRSLQSRQLPSFASGMIPSLSQRKREVLHALANGCTTAGAAEVLGVAVFTVNKHIAELKRILGANTTAQLTALAIQYDLLD